MQHALALFRRIEQRTRPDDPEVEHTQARRWNELPEHVRTPAQMLGRKFTGCEGTHGVFPACNFGCEPCYLGPEANRVAVDGDHAVAEVERQMAFLREHRGPGQYAQLIGGEVSLLPPEDHARALEVMRRHGRIPMSFTHGDFDLDHLEAIVLDEDGNPRFGSVSFAVHVDSTMRGRRAVKTPTCEADLDDERERIAEMFRQLRRRHGIRSYLAHNMTVTPDNIDEIPHVVRVCRRLGFRMNSFQPAAYVGDERRWGDGYRRLTADRVWRQIEQGVGRSLPHTGLQVGDPRCNRSTWGVWSGDTYVPLIEDDDPRALAARDAWFRAMPANVRLDSWPVKLARMSRSLGRHPREAATLVAGVFRLARRALPSLPRGRLRPRILPTTYVMHRFMDATDVRQAWELMQQDRDATELRLVETQERLRACAYGMAHPESGQVVPACVQHSVLDQQEHERLLQLLPRRPRGFSQPEAGTPPGR